MSNRIEKANGDTVLEITESVTRKRRLSLKRLTAQKEYLERTITELEADLAEVTSQIAMIHENDNAKR